MLGNVRAVSVFVTHNNVYWWKTFQSTMMRSPCYRRAFGPCLIIGRWRHAVLIVEGCNDFSWTSKCGFLGFAAANGLLHNLHLMKKIEVTTFPSTIHRRLLAGWTPTQRIGVAHYKSLFCFNHENLAMCVQRSLDGENHGPTSYRCAEIVPRNYFISYFFSHYLFVRS